MGGEGSGCFGGGGVGGGGGGGGGVGGGGGCGSGFSFAFAGGLVAAVLAHEFVEIHLVRWVVGTLGLRCNALLLHNSEKIMNLL